MEIIISTIIIIACAVLSLATHKPSIKSCCYTSTKPTKVYLAIPYSRVSKVMSYKTANEKSAELFRKGYHVYSPISMCHGMENMPKDWSFWEEYDTEMIKWADELHVVKMPGWDNSVGVQAEIKIARKLKKPVKYIEV